MAVQALPGINVMSETDPGIHALSTHKLQLQSGGDDRWIWKVVIGG